MHLAAWTLRTLRTKANPSKQSKDAIARNKQNVFLHRVNILRTPREWLSINAIEWFKPANGALILFHRHFRLIKLSRRFLRTMITLWYIYYDSESYISREFNVSAVFRRISATHLCQRRNTNIYGHGYRMQFMWRASRRSHPEVNGIIIYICRERASDARARESISHHIDGS